MTLFLKYLNRARPWTGVILLTLLMEGVLLSIDVVLPLFSRVLFDYAYPFKSFALLNVVIAAMAAAYLIQFWIDALADYQSVHVHEEFSMGLQTELFYRLQRMPVPRIRGRSEGEWVTRLTDDVEEAESLILSAPQAALLNLTHFSVIVVLCFTMNPLVTWLALASIPFYLIETRFFAERLARVQEDSFELQGGVLSHLHEKIRQIALVKAFRQEERESRDYRRFVKRGFVLGIKEKLLETFSAFTDSVTIQLWTVGITWYLGYQVIQGQLTIGEVVALGLLLGQLGAPIHGLGELISEWKTGLVSLRRIDEILTSPAEKTGGDTLRLKPGGGRIEFRVVNFWYEPDQPVLRDLDVTFPPRSSTALVGPSGAGKTTLVNLLLRYYDPQEGSIRIDGRPISELSPASLRESIGVVAQDYGIFEGSVRDNVAYGRPHANQHELEKAAERAAALDFIRRLPRGWDTRIGAHALSGGEKQRIALARALLPDPPILVFDEATSSLDPVSEFRVQQAVKELAATKTVVIIAHRLSTIRNADSIVVLEAGRVVETGAYETLMKRKGAFFRLHARQFGGITEFKKHLDIEHERARRNGSRYALGVFHFGGVESPESPTGASFMSEIALDLNASARLGDVIAPYDDGILLGLFPEVSMEQASRLTRRLDAVVGDKHSVTLCGFLTTFTDAKKLPVNSEDLLARALAAATAARGGEITVVDVASLPVASVEPTPERV